MEKKMEKPTAPAQKTFQSPVTGTEGVMPALYARWIEAVVHGPLPEESEATCSNCVMCPRSDQHSGTDQFFFDKISKCCTYTPTLANFIVGAILGDSAPSMTTGKAIIVERLNEGLAVDPLAIRPPPAYKLLYRHSQSAFGRNSTLRCPYLNSASGTCSIWQYRDPTCATWFCKHTRGKIGQSFWKALQDFLNAVSKGLSLWCILQLNIGDEALAILELGQEEKMVGENLQSNELDGRFDVDSAKKAWGRWWQREKVFYAECTRLISGLDFCDVEKICGPEVQVSSRLVKLAYDRMQETNLPTYLGIGHFEVEEATVDAVRVWSYSQLDPLDLPVPIFMALSYFDGRLAHDALTMAEHDLGIRIDHQVIRTLLDFGILQSTQISE